MKKLSAKDLGADLTPRCRHCDEKLKTVKIFDYSIVTLNVDNGFIHVCNPKKVVAHKKDMEKFIKETRIKQDAILKLKDTDENQLNRSFDI